MAASEELQDEIKRLKEDLGKLRGDVGDLLQVLRAAGLEQVAKSKDNITDELQRHREKVKAAVDKARLNSEKALDDLEENVSDHPLSAVLMAFGLGFIVAKLLNGGRD